MINNGIKHILLFVNYVLQIVDGLNLEYQSASVRIHKVHSIVSDGYRYLLSLLVKSSFIESMPLWKIEPSIPYFYKDTHDINLGGRCDVLLAQQPLLDQENRFRLDCLRFLVELCSQIKRFDFSETSILSQMCVLDPKVAMNVSNQRRPESLAYLASKFPTLVEESQLDQMHDQWKMLPTAVSTLQHMTNLSPDQFWPQIKSLTDGNDTPKFGLLSDFMYTMLTLPHSSACVEQIFSQVNMVKNKFTNRLHTTN